MAKKKRKNTGEPQFYDVRIVNPGNRKVKIPRRGNPSLTPEQEDLMLFTMNTRELYPDRKQVYRTLMQASEDGSLASAKANVLDHVDQANRMYKQEFGTGFSLADRQAVAMQFLEDFKDQYKHGELDWLLEDKPAKKASKKTSNKRGKKSNPAAPVLVAEKHSTNKRWFVRDEKTGELVGTPKGHKTEAAANKELDKILSRGSSRYVNPKDPKKERRDFLKAQREMQATSARPKFDLGDRIVYTEDPRFTGTVDFIGPYDSDLGGYRYKVLEADGTRKWWNETTMKRARGRNNTKAPRSSNPHRLTPRDMEWVNFILQDVAQSEGTDDYEITEELGEQLDAYKKKLSIALEEWTNLYPPKYEHSLREILDADAAYNVFMTLNGEGVGIWDGRWDRFYSEGDIRSLQSFLKKKLGSFADDTGGGTLNEAFRNAVFTAEENPPRMPKRGKHKVTRRPKAKKNPGGTLDTSLRQAAARLARGEHQ